MRFWGQNIQIDGTKIHERFEDPLASLYPPGEGPPKFVDHETSNPQAGKYESDTQDVIRQIARAPVGTTLIPIINALTNRKLIIRPVNQKAIDVTGAAGDNPQAARNPRSGSDVTIWYDPGTWNSADAKIGVDPGSHYKPDDVLFHEMVHALRMMRGMWDPSAIVNWDNREELFAVMLTNIYLSANNRNRDLRGDHQRMFHTLRKSLLQPAETQSAQSFYLENSTYIDSISRVMPDLCTPLSRISCSWNPLKAGIAYMNAVQQMF
jgi:hypothetical protein